VQRGQTDSGFLVSAPQRANTVQIIGTSLAQDTLDDGPTSRCNLRGSLNEPMDSHATASKIEPVKRARPDRRCQRSCPCTPRCGRQRPFDPAPMARRSAWPEQIEILWATHGGSFRACRLRRSVGRGAWSCARELGVTTPRTQRASRGVRQRKSCPAPRRGGPYGNTVLLATLDERDFVIRG